MKNILMFLGAVVLTIAIIAGAAAFGLFNTWFGNKVEYIDQKISDSTKYSTKKEVEDTCRAMIASYNADCLTYQQYDGSESKERQSWADQAKMRANQTAAMYNTYILENSFVWSENVPEDIRDELPYLD